MIEEDLAVLRTLQRLGARYLTLTHSFHLPWADSAGTAADPGPGIGGLNVFGRAVVRELNRLGVMVDVSHVADATFWDVIEEASAPVVATHSSTDAVFDHRRNLSDDMLRAIAKTGGVVMVNFFSGYIDPDWDGVPALPEGIDHCGDLPKLTALLLARGASETQLRGFLGENMLQAMEGCERRARELASKSAPSTR